MSVSKEESGKQAVLLLLATLLCLLSLLVFSLYLSFDKNIIWLKQLGFGIFSAATLIFLNTAWLILWKNPKTIIQEKTVAREIIFGILKIKAIFRIPENICKAEPSIIELTNISIPVNSTEEEKHAIVGEQIAAWLVSQTGIDVEVIELKNKVRN